MGDGTGQQGRSRRRWGLWLLFSLLALLAVGLGVLWWYAPELYASDDVSPGDQAAATATTRAGVLAVFAATIAAIGATVALAETRRANLAAHEREREAQVTDRYMRAIDQLGSDKLDMRLGGIYALERIARDSDRDVPTVVEVLCAFVRGHGQAPDNDNLDSIFEHSPPIDAQAAMSVIGRVHELDADGVHIDLSDAHLEHIRLEPANLTGAILWDADLRGAILVETVLERALLNGADLRHAALVGWTIRDPSYQCPPDSSPEATREYFYANLSGADLTGARLGKCTLHGVDLSQIKGLVQQQIDEADGSQATRLPKGLTRPAHWTSPPLERDSAPECTGGDST